MIKKCSTHFMINTKLNCKMLIKNKMKNILISGTESLNKNSYKKILRNIKMIIIKKLEKKNMKN